MEKLQVEELKREFKSFCDTIDICIEELEKTIESDYNNGLYLKEKFNYKGYTLINDYKNMPRCKLEFDIRINPVKFENGLLVDLNEVPNENNTN